MSAVALATLGAGFLNSAGSVYTNAINAANQYKINKDNIGMQYSINADQIEAARMNNETAINLANTAHQREVQDLRDAGLNPILSSNGSGSAVPSLDTPGLDAPQSAAPTADNPLSGISSAVGQAIQINDQHKLAEARAAILQGSVPQTHDGKPDIDTLRNVAREEANSAAAEARSRTAEAEYETKINQIKSAVMGRSLGVTPDGVMPFTDKDLHIPGAAGLIRDAIMSDIKNKGNENWRANLRAAEGAVNSAGSLIPGAGKMKILNKVLK